MAYNTGPVVDRRQWLKIMGLGTSFVAAEPYIGSKAAAQDQRQDSINWLQRLHADADYDGKVGFVDFLKFIETFGKTEADIGYNSQLDFVKDGNINFADFLTLVSSHFGKTQGSITGDLSHLLQTPGSIEIVAQIPTSTDPKLQSLTYNVHLLGKDGLQITLQSDEASKLAVGVYSPGDTITQTYQTGKQGEELEARIVGTDSTGDELLGIRFNEMMPVHYLNTSITGSEKVTFQVPDPRPEGVYLYAVADREKVDFHIDAGLLDIPIFEGFGGFEGNLGLYTTIGNKAVYQYNITESVATAPHTMFANIPRILSDGKVTNLIVSNNKNLKFKG